VPVEATWTLSQNRSPADLAGVVAGLPGEGAGTMAAVAQVARSGELG
jgi:hypothetical protein